MTLRQRIHALRHNIPFSPQLVSHIIFLKNGPNVSWLINSNPRERRAEFLNVKSL